MAVPSPIPVLLAAALLRGARGGAPSVYRDERFDLESCFSKRYEVGEALACEEARAIKECQPDDGNNVVLELRARCVPSPDGGATVCVGAQQAVNALLARRQTSRLGIPIGSTRSPVKVKPETVRERACHRRCFDAVGNQIVRHLRDSLRQGDGAPAPAPVRRGDPPPGLWDGASANGGRRRDSRPGPAAGPCWAGWRGWPP
ncbi:MAG: hypothetical protein PHF72_11770 [Gammaproteobacteria bacterium]|nr:hypothetical protein [Gammaproteobacteria bacterium]